MSNVAHLHQINPVTVHYKGELSEKDVTKRGHYAMCRICNKLLRIHLKGQSGEYCVLA